MTNKTSPSHPQSARGAPQRPRSRRRSVRQPPPIASLLLGSRRVRRRTERQARPRVVGRCTAAATVASRAPRAGNRRMGTARRGPDDRRSGTRTSRSPVLVVREQHQLDGAERSVIPSATPMAMRAKVGSKSRRAHRSNGEWTFRSRRGPVCRAQTGPELTYRYHCRSDPPTVLWRLHDSPSRRRVPRAPHGRRRPPRRHPAGGPVLLADRPGLGGLVAPDRPRPRGAPCALRGRLGLGACAERALSTPRSLVDPSRGPRRLPGDRRNGPCHAERSVHLPHARREPNLPAGAVPATGGRHHRRPNPSPPGHGAAAAAGQEPAFRSCSRRGTAWPGVRAEARGAPGAWPPRVGLPR